MFRRYLHALGCINVFHGLLSTHLLAPRQDKTSPPAPPPLLALHPLYIPILQVRERRPAPKPGHQGLLAGDMALRGARLAPEQWPWEGF